MANDLEFLQSLSEAELRELVLIPLLQAMGYTEIRHTHGVFELGKDLVFSQLDALQGKKTHAAVVKRTKLSGSVSNNRSIRELYFQITQALKMPYRDPLDGKEVNISRAYVFTPYDILPQCIESIASELRDVQNNVTFIDGSILLKKIEEYVPDLLDTLPDPRKRYLKVLYRRFIDQPTLSIASDKATRSISAIYTGGMLTRTTIQQAKYITFAVPGKPDGQRQLSAAHETNKYIVVLADVGAGKTTLLQKFLIDIAECSEDTHPQENTMVPLFVPLSRLTLNGVVDVETFVREVERYIAQVDGFDEFHKYRRKSVLMLDGFDEVDVPDIQLNRILQQLHRYFESIIITSRPSKMPLLVNRFTYYRLNPFSRDDIVEFLSKWYPNDPGMQTNLLRKIEGSDELKLFCRTPLILTLYVILSTKYPADDLPDRRTKIYSLIVEMLLGEWDLMRSVRNIFDPDMKKYALEVLAGQMQFSVKRSFKRDELVNIIREVLVVRMPGASPEKMWDEIVFRGSIIRQTEHKEVYEFVHLSFQEYLAAQYLVNAQRKSDLGKLLFEDWWRNTLIFYFGSIKNMNSVDIPMDIPQGKELRILEYLREAEFTGPHQKSRIYNIVLKTVLHSELTEDDCIIISGLGNEVRVRLNLMVNESQKHRNLDSAELLQKNYVGIMLLMKTEEATDNLFERQFVWHHLTNEDVLSLLPEMTKRVDTRLGRRFCENFLADVVQWMSQSDSGATTKRLPTANVSEFLGLKNRILELHHNHEIGEKKRKGAKGATNPYEPLKIAVEKSVLKATL